jgi:ABC transporter fused permease/ATP-binding protein
MARGEPLNPEDKRSLNKDNLKKLLGIFSFVLPYKWSFILGMISLALSSVTLLTFPFFAGKLLDSASGKSDFIINDVNTIALVLIGILIIQSIFSFTRVYAFARVSERSLADLRHAVFEKILALPVPFFDNRRVGELVSRITSDVSVLQDTFSVTLAELLRQSITLIAGVAVIFFLAPQLTLFMLATFPVLVVLALVFGKYIRKLSKKTQDKLAEANVIVEETLQSVNVVKSFTNESFESGRYKNALLQSVRIALQTAKYRGFFFSFVILAIFGGIVGVMWFGALQIQQGEITVGELTSFVLYTIFIGGSLAGLGDIYGQVQRAIGSSERLLEILAQEEERESGKLIPFKARGEISFNEVAFAYPTRKETAVLHQVNLHIKAGEKIALVGHSGAGKSTIINLLSRFYKPSSGEIKVDEININEIDLKAYRSNIGIVPQEVILFGGSIKENIAYGKPDANEEEIRQAAIKAHAIEFIDRFPEGMETTIGERGIKLSGGQRQRIAIARALLKDPAILILDEATSSLDAESEQLVQLAFDELMQNRTTIIIAHRLSTIRKADKIYVLKGGKIAESGSHEELTNIGNGIYNKLLKLQYQQN